MIKPKILSPTALARVLKKIKKRKVVFTNGCFDILHAGHVGYLERARKLGDILVVALNTDASTQRLKGPTRPMNPLQDRAAVIAALESVSYVTWFDEDTPLAVIKKIMPQVLVKGGDYRPQNIVGYAEVKAAGGTTKSLPFLRGRSTSNLIKKITQKN
jgi:rfaE bifunctional protein nucleotidyltransferase chain/domain